MTIELIPVIEIGYNNQGITAPDKYPWWNNSDLWDKYNSDSYALAGFKDKLTPYLPGSSLYKLADLTEDNLIKLTRDQTEGLRNGTYKREEATGFAGGYILRINGQDKFYPQCCSELSSILYWDRLANGKECYDEGHPEPQIEIKKDKVVLDFSIDENGEIFQPPCPETILEIDRTALKNAVEQTKIELDIFAKRLTKINMDEKLNIADIDRLLIWDNANY